MLSRVGRFSPAYKRYLAAHALAEKSTGKALESAQKAEASSIGALVGLHAAGLSMILEKAIILQNIMGEMPSQWFDRRDTALITSIISDLNGFIS